MPKLLYLEWVLLVMLIWISAGETILPNEWFFEAARKEISIFLIILFGSMGLFLPVSKKTKGKIIFTFIELLILGSILLSGGLRGLVLPYFVLVIRSCLIFDIIGQLLVIMIVCFFAFMSWRSLYNRITSLHLEKLQEVISAFGILFLVIFFLCLFFIIAMMTSLSSEKQSKEKLERANQKLMEYSCLEKERTKLEERNRIARDIHDSLGHSLTGMTLQLEAAIKLRDISPETSSRLINEAKALASRSLQDVRDVVRQLRIESSFAEDLKKLIGEVEKWNSIEIDLSLSINHFIPSETKTQMFRIVQEAISNIIKHAEATKVEIHVETSKLIILTIQDNGKGFRTDREHPGFGLRGINERSKTLGGVSEIRSSPDQGTTVKVTIPLLEVAS